MKNKKRLMIIGSILLSVALLSVTVFALLSHRDQNAEENEFYAADLAGRVDDEYTVTNSSDMPAVVRAMVLPVVTLSDGTLLSDGALDSGTLAADWKDGGDGYYYYTKPIPAGESVSVYSASPLPESPVPAGFGGAEITIEIKAEFSSAIEYETGKYTYRDAWFGGSAPTSAPLSTIDAAIQSAIQ